jgi:hypothetical protein
MSDNSFSDVIMQETPAAQGFLQPLRLLLDIAGGHARYASAQPAITPSVTGSKADSADSPSLSRQISRVLSRSSSRY